MSPALTLGQVLEATNASIAELSAELRSARVTAKETDCDNTRLQAECHIDRLERRLDAARAVAFHMPRPASEFLQAAY